MKTADEIRDMLKQCIGTESYHRHGLGRVSIVHTDGVAMLAKDAECHWLLDAIFSHITTNRKLYRETFQVWKLKRKPTHKSPDRAVLSCEDGNGNEILRQTIPFTDFPLDTIDLWYENGILMIPSER
jgi:hypothetical protein